MDEAFEEPAGGDDACPCEEGDAPADDMQDPADDLGEGVYEAPADDMQDPADDLGEGGFGYEPD